jgi:hypothetical protein
MLRDWAAPETVVEVVGVLNSIDAAARSHFGTSFVKLPPAKRTKVLTKFDEQRIYSSDQAYVNLKSLILRAYYLSEIGATVELRYQLVPGSWQPCVPITSFTRAWAV